VDSRFVGEIGGDEPGVAPGVFYGCGAVAVGFVAGLFDRYSIGLQGVGIGEVGIRYIDMQAGGHGGELRRGLGDFEGRVADADGGVEDGAFGGPGDAEGFCGEDGEGEGDHLVGFVEMQEGLHAGDCACGGSPAGAGDVPAIPEGIEDRALPVAPGLIGDGIEGGGSGFDGSLAGGVGIVEIEVDGGWGGWVESGAFAELDGAVAEGELGVEYGPVGAGDTQDFGCGEDVGEEVDAGGGVEDDEVRGERTQTGARAGVVREREVRSRA